MKLRLYLLKFKSINKKLSTKIDKKMVHFSKSNEDLQLTQSNEKVWQSKVKYPNKNRSQNLNKMYGKIDSKYKDIVSIILE